MTDQPNVLSTDVVSVGVSDVSFSSRRGWFFVNIVIPTLLLLLGGVAVVLRRKQVPPVKPPLDQSLAGRTERLPSVETLPVRSLDAVGGKLNLRVDGQVVPFRELTIATEVAGQIVYKDAACQVGSFVEQGHLLIRIDPTDYEHEIERLTKLKAQDYQAIRELDQELVNIDKLMEVAEQDVALQEREIARLRSLPKGYASQSELDSAQRVLLQAVNARLNLENQIATLRSRRIRLEAAESLAETQLQMARTNLQRTEIRAPVAGVIYREDAELNSFVQRGQVVFTLEDTSKSEVVISLRTDQLYWVLSQIPGAGIVGAGSPGEGLPEPTGSLDVLKESQNAGRAAGSYVLPKTPATITYQIAGRENERFVWEGELSRYDGLGLDPTSRTVPVRVVVPMPRQSFLEDRSGGAGVRRESRMALVRGMFVSVTLHVEPKRPLVVIPAVALKPGSSGSRVWKFVDDPRVVQLDGEAKQAPSPESSESGSLDVDAWRVGRIEVMEQIRPIEAMPLIETEEKDGVLAIGPGGKALYWVCEAGEQNLHSGDLLVVTPLPSFEGQGKDYVRIEKKKARSDGTGEEVEKPLGASPVAVRSSDRAR